MENGKKKYLQQNPASRRMLFMDLMDQIAQATEAINRLTRGAKLGSAVTVRTNKFDIILEETVFALYASPNDVYESTIALTEWFAARRLMLYGERNEWLETWPELVDLADLPPNPLYPVAPPETASNEATGP
jgi:hypothetical protein